MTISAKDIQTLRARSDAPMLKCKQALEKAAGDLDKAYDILREVGVATAQKKGDRVASEGIVVSRVVGDLAILLEINSETDFAARSEHFTAFVDKALALVIEHRPEDAEALLALPVDAGSFEGYRQALVGRIGENIQVRRLACLEAGNGQLAAYQHGQKIGVLLHIEAGDVAVARDVAMHVAATGPLALDEAGLPQEQLEKERQMFLRQVENLDKPEAIRENIVRGKLKKFIEERTLLGQAFVKDPNVKVRDYLKQHGTVLTRYLRFELGEGIEKKVVSFADEVAKARGKPKRYFPYQRVILKLSGEALQNDDGSFLSASTIERLVKEIIPPVKMGIQLGIVIGGGNLFRGAQLSETGIGRASADHMGMIGTVVNALALRDTLERFDQPARIMSAIPMSGIVDHFDRRKATYHLERGRVVIFAAGTGNPFVTTDSAASLRAIELDADVLLKGSNVDGIYDDDPYTQASATLYKRISYQEVLSLELKVMDLAAFCQCRDHNLPLRVFNISHPQALQHALLGEDEGTLVTNGDL